MGGKGRRERDRKIKRLEDKMGWDGGGEEGKKEQKKLQRKEILSA